MGCGWAGGRADASVRPFRVRSAEASRYIVVTSAEASRYIVATSAEASRYTRRGFG